MYSSPPPPQTLVIDLAGLDFLQDAVDRQFVAVELVDVIFQLRFAGQLGLDLDGRAERRAQLIERDDVEYFGSGDAQFAFVRVVRDRQQAVAAREILRHQFQRLRVGHHVGKVDRLLADRARHDVADRGLGDEAQAHQQAADRDVVLLLLGERDAQLVGGDQPLLDQQFA